MADKSNNAMPNEDLFENSSMTFGEHLEELRGTLFRAVFGLVIGFLIGLAVAHYVVEGIQTPLKTALEHHYEVVAEQKLQKLYGDDLSESLTDFMKKNKLTFEVTYIEEEQLRRLAQMATVEQNTLENSSANTSADSSENKSLDRVQEPNMQTLPAPSRKMVKTRIWKKVKSDVTALSAQEPFMIWLKAAFVAGLLIASPYMFWQIWSFVAAGLYPHEKRYVYLFLPISLLLFWSGAAMAFFFAFKYVLSFLFGFHRMLGIQSEPRISEWIGFVLFLPLGFGIAFQLPLVMLFLNRIGVLTVETYLAKWRIAVVVIAVVSMLLTPADPISMMLMAAPLTLLYFLGIAMAKWLPRGRSPFSDAYEP